jgi:hypothetical protein
MTPSEYAADELALWERALRDQRDAESQLEMASLIRNPREMHELRYVVASLRTRADLLLAEAVRVMCAYRDGCAATPDLDRPVFLDDEDLDFEFDFDFDFEIEVLGDSDTAH